MVSTEIFKITIVLSAIFFTCSDSYGSHSGPLQGSHSGPPHASHSGPPPQQPDKEDIGEYDFIIVGAGSAGSVLANRLTEIHKWKILLLEVGFPEDFMAEWPTLLGAILLTDYNWNYFTEPQTNACLAMEEQRCPWPKGKALGGSSVINGLVYTRGNPADYNNWVALGNPGWSYEDVLPYFLKSEQSHLKVSNPAYHNKHGEMGVSNPITSDLGRAFIAAGQELGYQMTDYNSPEQEGFSRIQANIRQGRRHSAAQAFIEPIRYRDNLRVITGAMVTKVLIHGHNKKAYGVEFDFKNKTFTARARKEVIVSAGVINTPQLLMLSGIGPRNHLRELGITTLKDLPVGQTIYDHMGFGGLVINTNFSAGGPITLDPLQILDWYETGEGRLSSPGGFDALAFVETDSSIDYPDVELLLRLGSIISDNGTFGKLTLRVTDDYYNQMYAPLEGTTSFTVLPVVLHPKSKGHMKLRSTNPYDYPLLYPNYFTDPEKHDLQTLVNGTRMIARLCQTSALKKYNAQINTKPFTRCEHLTYDSDEYWQCVMKQMASPAHHQISSCKMGPPNDPTAVVSNELKVYGISNLRVVDASVMPAPVSAHTHAPTVMIAEVASDLIKKQWGAFPHTHKSN